MSAITASSSSATLWMTPLGRAVTGPPRSSFEISSPVDSLTTGGPAVKIAPCLLMMRKSHTGATSAPWAEVLTDEGTFHSPEDLRRHYAALGIEAPAASPPAADTGDGDGSPEASPADGTAAETTAIAYCGSGVSACMNVLAMEHAGLTPPRLFVASWSGWSADPEREAALGE